MRIFVSIVSYRDPLLYNTVMSLLEMKSGLCDITVGIFEQTDKEHSLERRYPEIIRNPDIVYKRIDPEHSNGVGWARHINCLQMENEEFYYQIDSHMMFDKNWDRELIKDYQLAVKKYNNKKVIITANCKNLGLDENNKPFKIETNPITCKSTYHSFYTNLTLGAHGEWIEAQSDVSDAIHIFAGNMFTCSEWVKEIGPNPRIYFNGEEQYLTLSSFRAGYSICHPREIHCYHLVGTGNYLTKQWIDPVISEKKIAKFRQISDAEFRDFLIKFDDKTYENYRRYSGVDYLNRKLETRALSWSVKSPPNVVSDWEIPDRIE